MTGCLDKAKVEIVTVGFLCDLGYEHIHGPQIAPDGETPERADYGGNCPPPLPPPLLRRRDRPDRVLADRGAPALDARTKSISCRRLGASS